MKLKKILIFSVLAGIALAFVIPQIALAEVVIFRIPGREYFSGTNILKGFCDPMTLSENLSARTVGTVGPDCSFDVEVKPMGEWVSTGGYFDTPPYAWVTNTFYTANGDDYSFTCKNAATTLNRTSLPSYVRILSESNIAATSSTGPGKKFTVKIDPSAAQNSSFNMDFSFSSNCEMIKKVASTPTTMSPVERSDADP